MLKRSGERRYSCLDPDLSRKSLSFSPLNIMLVTGVFVDILYQIETVPSINTFLRVFIMNGFWILSNAFLNFFHLLIMIM